MNRTNVQAFAFGIAFTAIVIYIYSFFFQSATEQEMIKELNAKDYHVLTAGEFEAWQDKVDSLTDENEALLKQVNTAQNGEADQEKDQAEADNDAEVKTVIFRISEGMTVETIASELVELDVIADETSLTRYFLEHGLDRNIQLGTYHINNQMSIEEIARLITK